MQELNIERAPSSPGLSHPLWAQVRSMLCLAPPLRDPYLHLLPIGSERALTYWGGGAVGRKSPWRPHTARRGNDRGWAVGRKTQDTALMHPCGLVPLPWPLEVGSFVSRPSVGAALWATVGEAGSVIHAGSPQHSQGPLPCASPEH